jgi:DNA modification methylase
MFPSLAATDRATHQLHPYPAKLLRHIPAFFASVPCLSSPGDTIFDPFCGSGTVLVEAQLAGRHSVGLDTNPLAELLARVKTTPLDAERLRRALRRMLQRAGQTDPDGMPVPVGATYWFHARTIDDLRRLRISISKVRDPDVRAFMLVCLSATARGVSLADPRIAVPVRLRADQYPRDHWLHEKTRLRLRMLRSASAISEFERVAGAAAERVGSLPASGPRARVLNADARYLASEDADVGTVDCVITSPPYLGAQKYIRASSVGLMWLGHTTDGKLQRLARRSIGREHFAKAEYCVAVPCRVASARPLIEACREDNPLRAHLATVYLHEMDASLAGIHSVLKPGGRLVLVAGPNRLVGRDFPTPQYLVEMAQRLGFSVELELVDTIRSRGLMTRRNRSASMIARETVTVLKKRKRR